MMVWSPQCCIPSFMKIGQLVLEKKNFEGFYHIWAWRPSWSCDQDHVNNFHFLVPESFHTKFTPEWPNLVQNGTVISEKIWFEFLYVHDLGPRSRNDLDLQYSHTLIKSISCLYLPTFRSQASVISEKSTVFTFSYRKA